MTQQWPAIMQAYLFAHRRDMMFAVLFGGGICGAIALIAFCKILAYMVRDGEKNGWFRF
jgi:hypothetical protein